MAIAGGGLFVVGCGTTRSSDTIRTATEQLLISDAIDRAVGALDVGAMAGQSVFLDSRYLANVTDSNYLISSIRQHLLGSGCVLMDHREAADFIVEARAGAVGTSRHDLLFGIPAMNLPQLIPMPGIPTAIPEVPIAKRRDQRGVAKVALFAYQRETGLPVWQSGIAQQESTLNDVWLLGAGPFQGGTIQQGASFAGKSLEVTADDTKPSSLALQSTFANPSLLAGNARRLPRPYGEIALAGHEEPVSKEPVSKEPAPEKSQEAASPNDRTATGSEAIPHVPVELTGAPLFNTSQPLFNASQQMEPIIETHVTAPNAASHSGLRYSVEAGAPMPDHWNQEYWEKSQVVNPQPDCLVPLPQPIIDSPPIQ